MKSLFTQSRKNLRVAWRVPVVVQTMIDKQVVTGVSRNISSSGVLLFCDAPLEVGTAVVVTLDLRSPGEDPDCEVWPMRIPGKVARVEGTPEGTLAITFAKLEAATQRSLRVAVVGHSLQLMERISEFPAFWDLTELDQLALTTVCHEVHLEAGETLARCGDEATSLFLVKSGRVQLRSPNLQRADDPAAEVAHAGQIFGEVSALLNLPHNLDIFAEVETELLAIPRDSLLHLRDHNPNLVVSLFEIFSQFMGRRLRKMTNRLFAPVSM